MEFISLESKENISEIPIEKKELIPESSLKKCSIVIAIPTKTIGLIIGKNGQNFKEISEISGSKFNIQPIDDLPQESRTRCALIKGNSKSVLSAVETILNKMHFKSSEGVLKWVILQSFTGILIGKGGSKIKSINERSGAWVKVAHIDESASMLNERLVYIRGTPEQNAVALALVQDLVGGRPYISNSFDLDTTRLLPNNSNNLIKSSEIISKEIFSTTKLIHLRSISFVLFNSQSMLNVTNDWTREQVIENAHVKIIPDFEDDFVHVILKIWGLKYQVEAALNCLSYRLQKWEELEVAHWYSPREKNIDIILNSTENDNIDNGIKCNIPNLNLSSLPINISSVASTPRSAREEIKTIYSNSIIPKLSFTDLATTLSQNTPRTGRSLNSSRKHDSVRQITPRLAFADLKSEISIMSVILSSFIRILLNESKNEDGNHILDVIFKNTGVVILLLPTDSIISNEINAPTRMLIFVGSTIKNVIAAQDYFLEYLLNNDLFISSTPLFSINDDKILNRIGNSLKVNTVPQFTQYVQQQPHYGYQQFSPPTSPQYVVISDNKMNNFQNSYQNVVYSYPPHVQVIHHSGQMQQQQPMFVQVIPHGIYNYSPNHSPQYHSPPSQGWIYSPSQNFQNQIPKKKKSFKNDPRHMKENSNSESEDIKIINSSGN